MKKRLITGIFIAAVFIAVVLLSLAVSAWVYDIFVLALMLLAAHEMCRALSQKFAKPFEILILIAIILGYGAFWGLQNYLDGFNSALALPVFVAVLCIMVLVAALWTAFDKNKNTQNVVSTGFVLVYPVTVLIFMAAINFIPSAPHRAAAILLLFLVAPFTDVFAFLVGSRLKGPKLAPKISPKKTISGAIGGLLGGIIAGLIVCLLIFINTSTGVFDFMGLAKLTKLDALHFGFMGLLGSVFTQAGDLAASMVKRRTEIKDYGRLLPGHGGIMDRIDGMMLAAVAIYLYMTILLIV